MPIITTKRPGADRPLGLQTFIASHRAVGTLDEARDATNTAAERARATDAVFAEIEALAISGGTVGPLPDGTVVEVGPIAVADLFNVWRDSQPFPVRAHADAAYTMNAAEIIDAYNAAQED